MKTTRNTVAKSRIQDLLNESAVALSHHDIQLKLEGMCDRVTIYRVLERLSEAGLVHKVINYDGAIKYAACHNCSPEHHHNHVHFSCQKCKSVICIENVEPTFRLPANYKIKEVSFTVSGICPDCSADSQSH